MISIVASWSCFLNIVSTNYLDLQNWTAQLIKILNYSAAAKNSDFPVSFQFIGSNTLQLVIFASLCYFDQNIKPFSNLNGFCQDLLNHLWLEINANRFFVAIIRHSQFNFLFFRPADPRSVYYATFSIFLIESVDGFLCTKKKILSFP